MRMSVIGVVLLGMILAVPALATDAPTTAPATTRDAPSPEAEALLKLVPRLSDQDPARKSFDVTATVGEGVTRAWIFRAVYRAPDERAMYIYHALDGTPVVIVAGGQLVVFDAVHGKILRMQDYATHFALSSDADGKLAVNWGFNPTHRPAKKLGDGQAKEEPKGFLFDLPTLFSRAVLRVEAAEAGRERLIGLTDRGGTITALLDGAHPGHLIDLELVTQDGRAGLVVDRISIDQPVEDRLFIRPDLAGFGDRMEVVDKEIRVESPEAFGRAIQEFSVAMMGRVAIHDTEWRLQMKGAFGPVDWQLAEAIDRIATPMVREVLGVAPGTYVTTRPAEPGAKAGGDSNAGASNKTVPSTHQ